MFRINHRNRILPLENLLKRTNFQYSDYKYSAYHLFLKKHKYHQQSSFFPVLLGVSTLGLAALGITYHYYEDFRTNVKSRLPRKSQILLDEYIGPYNVDNFRKNWQNFTNTTRSYFSSTAPQEKRKNSVKNEAKPIATEMNEMNKVQLSSTEAIKANIQKEADRITKLNEEFETRVGSHVANIETMATNAVLHLMEYEAKIQDHSEKLKRAIEDDGTTKPNPWEEVNASLHLQQTARMKSESEMRKLESGIKQLEKVLEEGEKSEHLKSSSQHQTGRKMISDTNYRVKQKEADIEKAQFNAQITNQYKELIQQGRERFKQELASLSPSVSNWTKKRADKLSPEDLNALIVHAHRRMHQLQARIVELESMEVIRLEEALSQQRSRDEAESTERVRRELERERSRLSLEQRAELDAVNEKHEMDMRKALTRQASAHSEHVNQLLIIQKEEVDRQHNLAVREALLRERERMRAAIEGWRMRVEGLEAAVEGRADEERVSREAQDMWVACHALHGVLNGNSCTPPLARYLASFEEAAQPSSLPVLRIFLDSIPRCALDDGVYTQHLLAKRFEKIKATCRRVAMIDETSAPLGMYFMSWLRSLFILTPSHLIEADTEVDLLADDLDTHQIIASADLAICRQDIDLAVRLLNLLKGMPRAVVHDWIADARVYLETRLAAEALSSYTSAKTAGSVPPELVELEVADH